MGLFSFVGKAIKGIGKVVGGALKVGTSLGLVPGGGLLGLASHVLHAKQPMGTSAQKITVLQRFNPNVLRGNMSVPIRATPHVPGPQVLRASPVLPGGAIATRSGPAAPSGVPPASYGGSKTGKRKRRSPSSKRSSRARSTKKRRGGKLKFGSPAWRKKYMKRGRSKRR